MNNHGNEKHGEFSDHHNIAFIAITNDMCHVLHYADFRKQTQATQDGFYYYLSAITCLSVALVKLQHLKVTVNTKGT